ncbi:MAG TPA: hypothetical protein VFI60_10870 [Candidatus Acidoferrum sp.]|nr:hypothetical protein [Candidatus Acidoferrum sp.]
MGLKGVGPLSQQPDIRSYREKQPQIVAAASGPSFHIDQTVFCGLAERGF